MPISIISFNFSGQRPGPPPTILPQTFAYKLAGFFVDLEAKGYTQVGWNGSVNRNGPPGPAVFSGSISCKHAVPITNPSERPETVFASFILDLSTHGWNVEARSTTVSSPV